VTYRPTLVRVNGSALEGNLRWLKQKNGAAFFCPMLKANAYGHGDQIVGRVVERVGADAVGVALIEEGLQLRAQGFRSIPILVFAPFDQEGARAMGEHQLTPIVCRVQDLETLSKCADNVEFHLKFNTGMNRLGLDAEDLPAVRHYLQKNPQLKVTGVCTHFSRGEDINEAGGHTHQQLEAFLRLSQEFPGVRHAHKSISLIRRKHELTPEVPSIGSRPGIAVYGLEGDGQHLQRALSWHTELVNVHHISQGTAVGYGGRWVAPRDSWVGVVPVGYGDGYMRGLSNRAHMLFRGKRVPVVGSVCMDYTLLDLTACSLDGVPQNGEHVVVLGTQGQQEISAQELADHLGTISYEVVTAIHPRVMRELV